MKKICAISLLWMAFFMYGIEVFKGDIKELAKNEEMLKAEKERAEKNRMALDAEKKDAWEKLKKAEADVKEHPSDDTKKVERDTAERRFKETVRNVAINETVIEFADARGDDFKEVETTRKFKELKKEDSKELETAITQAKDSLAKSFVPSTGKSIEERLETALGTKNWLELKKVFIDIGQGEDQKKSEQDRLSLLKDISERIVREFTNYNDQSYALQDLSNALETTLGKHMSNDNEYKTFAANIRTRINEISTLSSRTNKTINDFDEKYQISAHVPSDRQAIFDQSVYFELTQSIDEVLTKGFSSEQKKRMEEAEKVAKELNLDASVIDAIRQAGTPPIIVPEEQPTFLSKILDAAKNVGTAAIESLSFIATLSPGDLFNILIKKGTEVVSSINLTFTDLVGTVKTSLEQFQQMMMKKQLLLAREISDAAKKRQEAGQFMQTYPQLLELGINSIEKLMKLGEATNSALKVIPVFDRYQQQVAQNLRYVVQGSDLLQNRLTRMAVRVEVMRGKIIEGIGNVGEWIANKIGAEKPESLKVYAQELSNDITTFKENMLEIKKIVDDKNYKKAGEIIEALNPFNVFSVIYKKIIAFVEAKPLTQFTQTRESFFKELDLNSSSATSEDIEKKLREAIKDPTKLPTIQNLTGDLVKALTALSGEYEKQFQELREGILAYESLIPTLDKIVVQPTADTLAIVRSFFDNYNQKIAYLERFKESIEAMKKKLDQLSTNPEMRVYSEDLKNQLLQFISQEEIRTIDSARRAVDGIDTELQKQMRKINP